MTRNFNKFRVMKFKSKIPRKGAESSFEHRVCVPLENMETMGKVTLRLPEFAYI